MWFHVGFLFTFHVHCQEMIMKHVAHDAKQDKPLKLFLNQNIKQVQFLENVFSVRTLTLCHTDLPLATSNTSSPCLHAAVEASVLKQWGSTSLFKVCLWKIFLWWIPSSSFLISSSEAAARWPNVRWSIPSSRLYFLSVSFGLFEKLKHAPDGFWPHFKHKNNPKQHEDNLFLSRCLNFVSLCLLWLRV